MDHLIAERTETAEGFLRGLLELETNYTTICSQQLLKGQTMYLNELKKGRQGWCVAPKICW